MTNQREREHYDKKVHDPRVIEFCTKCEKKTCDGECVDLKMEMVRLFGVRHRAAQEPRRGSTGGSTGAVYEYHGERHTLREWSIILGVSKNALYKRLRQGISFEEAVGVKRRGRTPDLYTIGDRTLTLREWAKAGGMAYDTLRKRVARGEDLAAALERGVKR